jgi:hypothetical protein
MARPSPVPAIGGVYAWYFSAWPTGIDASACIERDGLKLLYAGISPSPPPGNGKAASRQTLRSRLRSHLCGNAAGSTLRRTLGCLLSDSLGLCLRRVGSTGRRYTFTNPGERVLDQWLGGAWVRDLDRGGGALGSRTRAPRVHVVPPAQPERRASIPEPIGRDSRALPREGQGRRAPGRSGQRRTASASDRDISPLTVHRPNKQRLGSAECWATSLLRPEPLESSAPWRRAGARRGGSACRAFSSPVIGRRLIAPPARMSSTTRAGSSACRSALRVIAARSRVPPLPARLCAAAQLQEQINPTSTVRYQSVECADPLDHERLHPPCSGPFGGSEAGKSSDRGGSP